LIASKTIDNNKTFQRGKSICCFYMHKLLEQEIRLVGKENVVLWGSRQGCAVALSTLLTQEGGPFAALVGMSGWLPLENLVWDVANGDDSRLRDDEDEFYDIEAFWERSLKMTKIMIGRPKLPSTSGLSCSYKSQKGEVFKQNLVFMVQSRKDRIAGLGTQAKKCLEIIRVDV
jgi:hypothetical protein